MNQKIVKYFLVAIAISTTGSIVAYAQQHQHGEQHNDLQSPYTEQLDSPVRGLSYGELRKTHLQAHLQINPLLSAEQIKKYNQIRGYEIAK